MRTGHQLLKLSQASESRPEHHTELDPREEGEASAMPSNLIVTALGETLGSGVANHADTHLTFEKSRRRHPPFPAGASKELISISVAVNFAPTARSETLGAVDSLRLRTNPIHGGKPRKVRRIDLGTSVASRTSPKASRMDNLSQQISIIQRKLSSPSSACE